MTRSNLGPPLSSNTQAILSLTKVTVTVTQTSYGSWPELLGGTISGLV